MTDTLFEPARYDKAPALFGADLAPHPHVVDTRAGWDMTAQPGDLVRVTHTGGGYRSTYYEGELIEPVCVYAPKVRESGDWGSCDHCNDWTTLTVIERNR